LITLYGIKNCDTVKKARKWLDSHGIEYHFHDFREAGNRRSTSWKGLAEQDRLNMNDATALKAILNQPTLIKRPLLDTGKQRYAGFSAASYAKIFSAHTL